jgi:hypothetical protein
LYLTFTGGACAQKPLSEWKIRATRDSLAECENLKAVWIEKGQMYLGESDARSRAPGSRIAPNEADYMADIEATCVAADDTRLREK